MYKRHREKCRQFPVLSEGKLLHEEREEKVTGRKRERERERERGRGREREREKMGKRKEENQREGKGGVEYSRQHGAIERDRGTERAGRESERQGETERERDRSRESE